MDDKKDIGVAFDSPAQIRAMRKRHLVLGLAMQEVGVRGLNELRERGNLTAEECAELLEAGMKLESTVAPGGSRKRH